jgi:hypothetical protein
LTAGVAEEGSGGESLYCILCDFVWIVVDIPLASYQPNEKSLNLGSRNAAIRKVSW